MFYLFIQYVLFYIQSIQYNFFVIKLQCEKILLPGWYIKWI